MCKSVNIAILGAIALVMAGCGNETDPLSISGRVAVVDLDEVAKQLGRDVEMRDSLKAQQETLNDELKVVQTSFVDQINAKKIEFEKSEPGQTNLDIDQNPVQHASAEEDLLSDEEKQQLAVWTRNANINLNQRRQSATTRLSRERVRLVNSFRAQVKPIAREVARERGLTIVVSKNDSVIFAYEGAVDITNEVVKRLKASGG